MACDTMTISSGIDSSLIDSSVFPELGAAPLRDVRPNAVPLFRGIVRTLELAWSI